jgi:hypothetical protein
MIRGTIKRPPLINDWKTTGDPELIALGWTACVRKDPFCKGPIMHGIQKLTTTGLINYVLLRGRAIAGKPR